MPATYVGTAMTAGAITIGAFALTLQSMPIRSQRGLTAVATFPPQDISFRGAALGHRAANIGVIEFADFRAHCR